MSTGELPLEGSHWAFAVDVYRRPGIAEACLLLQDDFGVDISLLMFVLHAAATRNIAFPPSRIAELDAAVIEWRTSVVAPLRALRRRLKSGPLPAPHATTEGLRHQIKSAELRAEKIEMAALAAALDKRPSSQGTGKVDVRAVLENIAHYYAARVHGIEAKTADTRLHQALDAICDAVATERPARAEGG